MSAKAPTPAEKAAGDIIAGWTRYKPRAERERDIAALIDSALSDERARAARMEEALKRLVNYCEAYADAGPGDWEDFRKSASAKQAYAALGAEGGGGRA